MSNGVLYTGDGLGRPDRGNGAAVTGLCALEDLAYVPGAMSLRLPQLVLGPLRWHGTTGSPVNRIAIF